MSKNKGWSTYDEDKEATYVTDAWRNDFTGEFVFVIDSTHPDAYQVKVYNEEGTGRNILKNLDLEVDRIRDARQIARDWMADNPYSVHHEAIEVDGETVVIHNENKRLIGSFNTIKSGRMTKDPRFVLVPYINGEKRDLMGSRKTTNDHLQMYLNSWEGVTLGEMSEWFENNTFEVDAYYYHEDGYPVKTRIEVKNDENVLGEETEIDSFEV